MKRKYEDILFLDDTQTIFAVISTYRGEAMEQIRFSCKEMGREVMMTRFYHDTTNKWTVAGAREIDPVRYPEKAEERMTYRNAIESARAFLKYGRGF